MAARQGLSAHISQASEDAKRAVLQRTSLHNSLWFSNLNTTCTIKSAPPRTPDVLGMLGSKAGWLLKRNEQHVWQARWCCVVPHTFLYYFDAHPAGADVNQAPQLTSKQQEMLNAAVKEGYGKRGAAKHHQPRSSLYHVLGTGAGQTTGPQSEIDQDGHANHSLQPAGIIDLECYTTVHRNSQNQFLMELAGDETVNPDLRSFYFCASSVDEGEEWTKAFLSQRHGALVDEKEAYRQVCDGFAQQLQDLHNALENTQRTVDSQQDELYRVRSSMEDTRRSCWRLVQDTLERSDGSLPAKKAYKTDLESIQAQDLGLLSGVQLLCDYTRVLEETCSDSNARVNRLEIQLAQKKEGNQSKVEELNAELARMQQQMDDQQDSHHMQMEKMQQSLLQSQKECQDVQKDLATQRMEMTMYQSATRTKIGELQSHKKILKKEVIELRQKLEEVHSDLDLQKHKQSSSKLEVEQERQKAKLLERYVEQMIQNQAKVQQGMMDLMSSAGSQYGGGSHFQSDRSFNLEVPDSPGLKSAEISKFSNLSRDFQNLSPAPQKSKQQPRGYDGIIDSTPSSVHQDDGDADKDDHSTDRFGNAQSELVSPTAKNADRRNNIDDDNKSHLSELTEDRTQKQFDAAFMFQNPSLQARNAVTSPRGTYLQQNNFGPPSIIGVTDETDDPDNKTPKKLDTIMSSHSALHSRGPSRTNAELSRHEIIANKPSPRAGGDSGSITSFGSSQKLSVAQRARMEADQHATPVRLRLNTTTTPLRGNSSGQSPIHSSTDSHRKNRQQHAQKSRVTRTTSSNSNGSFFSNIGRRIEEAIDSSVLGVDVEDSDEESCNTAELFNKGVAERRESDRHHDEKKTQDCGSVASTNVSLSLAERQQLQRQQQMKFLKNQGLIRDEAQLRGGAGAASPSRQATTPTDGGSSVGSISFSTFGR